MRQEDHYLLSHLTPLTLKKSPITDLQINV